MPIYGIDLGTTNSLIGLGESLLSGLVPSVVDIEKKIAGESLKESLTAARSFKIDVSMSVEGNRSVIASRYVLEELRRQAGGSCVKQVVISVPAYFSDNQRQATIKAANLAGLEVVSLINEPTAAAMYISKSHRALSLVYDLGGGTFDVSVIDSRFDNYDVQATDGLIVGGDNMDQAIMRYLIKEGGIARHRQGKDKLMQLQLIARSLKEDMQKAKLAHIKAVQDFDGDLEFNSRPMELEVDLTEFAGSIIIFKEETYISLMKMTFAETIIKTRKVIGEAIPFGERYDILLVGGSTRCPYLRAWLRKELGKAPVELSYDPDKVVAQGAALFAQMIETGEADIMVSDVTNALSIGLSDGTVRTIIEKNSKIPIVETTMVVNDKPSAKMRINLYQGDSLLSESNECIGTLVYDYGEVKDSYMGEVIVEISVESSGVITFSCKELLKQPVTIVLDRSLSGVK